MSEDRLIGDAPHPIAYWRARAEKAEQARANLTTAIERLIEERGGRCVKPADYDPTELNFCEKHHEAMFGDEECEDQPRDLLAVLDIIRRLSDE